MPPGEYTLTAYWRGCVGHCGNLSHEAEPICQADVVLASQDRGVVHVIPRDLSPGSECAIEVQPG